MEGKSKALRKSFASSVLVAAVLLLLAAGPCRSGESEAPGFSYKKFHKNEATAKWITAKRQLPGCADEADENGDQVQVD